MSKELILKKLEEQGFSIMVLDEYGYAFKYEELTLIYIPDDDERFLRFGVPNIFDVTTGNRPFVLEVINDTNKTIKYGKTCLYGEKVWVFYEYRLFGEDHIDDIIKHCFMVLLATIEVFHRKIEEDKELTQEDEVR